MTDPVPAGVGAEADALNLLLALISDRPCARIGQGMDAAGWNRFADLAIHVHRVAGLVDRALAKADPGVPDRVRGRIAEAARRHAFSALACKAETRRIAEALAPLPTPAVMVKGWPLGERLTGSAALRHAKDVDLMLAPAALPEALARLREIGHVPAPPHRVRVAAIARPEILQGVHNLTLLAPPGNLEIEIHWRSYPFRHWPDLADFAGATEPHPIDATGVSIAVPADGAHLVYLALHGEWHLWLRLKWVWDVHAMAARRGSHGLRHDLALARRIGAERALVLALHLSARLLGTALPADWPALDAGGRRAERTVLHLIAGGVAPGTPRARFETYRFALRRAATAAQRWAVLDYLGPRRARLALSAWRRDGAA